MNAEYEGMVFEFDQKGFSRFYPAGTACKQRGRSLVPACVSTVEDGPFHGMEWCENVSFEPQEMQSVDFREDGYTATYQCGALEVVSEVSFAHGVAVETNRVTNRGKEPKTLRHLSSCVLAGLDRGGKKYWFEPGKFQIHFCRYGWSAEAQWCTVTPQQLGIYPGSDQNQGYQSSFRISSRGSWSTGSYYPILILEDLETQTSYFVEMLGPGNWFIEIGHCSDPKEGSFYIEANSADADAGRWEKRLAPGETYETIPSLFGCVSGGLEEVVRVLTPYKRKISLSQWEKGVPYVCFNDYMNGLRGRLSAERCIPLIDAAAEAGAEVYCMDAGWAGVMTEQGLIKTFGDWTPADVQFGTYGLQGVMDYIRSKGMIAGIWLELEGFAEGSPLYERGLYLKKPDGTPCKMGARYFADMTNPEVRKHLKGVVDRMYKMGIRYIKNDYNASTMTGVSIDGSSPGEGNNLYAKAVREFFADIRRTYPDLILENCGSGGMRCDQGMLSIFTLQSITDEEGYLYIPAILAGSIALMPPEKAGVWCYAYPENTAVKGELCSPAYLDAMKDGEETVFNMVTGMFGCMTLGGRFDRMDETNRALVKEAVERYKQNRTFVSEGVAVYPCGMPNKGTGKNTAFGLLHERKKQLLLGVWRFSENNSLVSADLSKYGKVRAAEMVYPSNPLGATYQVEGNTLTVTLPKKNSARLFLVELE